MIASGFIKIFADAGLQVTSISTSLLAVLMFGAGTDYCLLLVARYSEELHYARGPQTRRCGSPSRAPRRRSSPAPAP